MSMIVWGAISKCVEKCIGGEGKKISKKKAESCVKKCMSGN